MDSLLSGPYLTFALIVAFGAFVWMFWDLYQMTGTDGALGGSYRPTSWPRAAQRPEPEKARAQASNASASPPPGGRTAHQFSGAVEIWLERDSGELRGRVMHGPFRGRGLESLSRMECLALFESCEKHDAEAARLLTAYLTRRFGPGFNTRAHGRPAPEGPLTRARALEILGLTASARRAEIVAAHRVLIKKHHPDRGGSTAKAALINQAKDLLLAEAT